MPPIVTLKEELNMQQFMLLNLLGEKVAELVKGELTASYRQIEFNSTRLSSGVYIYQLQAGSFRNTKKMMFVR